MKIENVFNLPARARYDYFIRKAADFQTVWGLCDGGWATVAVNETAGIPFWPEPEFAQACATGVWQSYVPREIPLDLFILNWMPGTERDGKVAAIRSDQGSVVNMDQLLYDLKGELRQYE